MSNTRAGPQTRLGPASRGWLVGAVLGFVLCAPARAADPVGPLRVEGKLPHDDDLSAVVSIGPFLVVASDEGASLGVLEPTGEPNGYRVQPDPIPLATVEDEIDIEALARVEDTLYVLASHSLKRRRVDPASPAERNRARLADVSDEPLRQSLYRLTIDPRTGRPTAPPRRLSLRPLLVRDRIVGPFTRIPAEENGVNLEGLAADGHNLYVGFRSPVLREGFVPVLQTSWGDAQSGELLLLDLGGRGIRSLERVAGGFLMIARGEHGEGGSEGIYFWNGADGVPGSTSTPVRIERLLELRSPPGANAEGLCVTAEADDHWDVVVIHDGVPGGHPLRLRMPRVHSTR